MSEKKTPDDDWVTGSDDDCTLNPAKISPQIIRQIVSERPGRQRRAPPEQQRVDNTQWLECQITASHWSGSSSAAKHSARITFPDKAESELSEAVVTLERSTELSLDAELTLAVLVDQVQQCSWTVSVTQIVENTYRFEVVGYSWDDVGRSFFRVEGYPSDFYGKDIFGKKWHTVPLTEYRQFIHEDVSFD
jgi:hypothetical protein